MNQPSSPPEHEPGGDRIMIVVAVIVITALGGMLWSFLSRQAAPREAPPIKARHLPPSEQPAKPQAPTVPPVR